MMMAAVETLETGTRVCDYQCSQVGKMGDGVEDRSLI